MARLRRRRAGPAIQTFAEDGGHRVVGMCRAVVVEEGADLGGAGGFGQAERPVEEDGAGVLGADLHPVGLEDQAAGIERRAHPFTAAILARRGEMAVERPDQQREVADVGDMAEAHRREVGEAVAGEGDGAGLAAGGAGDLGDGAGGGGDAPVVAAGAEAGGEVGRPEEELGDAGNRGDLGGGVEAGGDSICRISPPRARQRAR